MSTAICAVCVFCLAPRSNCLGGLVDVTAVCTHARVIREGLYSSSYVSAVCTHIRAVKEGYKVLLA